MVGNRTAPSSARRLLLAAGLGLGLAGCTTALPPEKVTAMGGPFNDELRQGYIRLANGQWSDVRLGEWHHFRGKAERAMLGDVVWPDKVASRSVPEAVQGEALATREGLLRALEGGARASAPADAAIAQVGFDCWLEELERVTPPAPLGDCREVALAALERAEATLVHTPYLVYFDRGSDQLDLDAKNAVFHAARAAAIAEPAAIAVTGYADASGGAADNEALSRRRAEAVAEALRTAGVSSGEIRVGARGALPGTSERQARRVEISFDG
jgi:outer membrane protein OmpA-like peptidoglycan-associated protein